MVWPYFINSSFFYIPSNVILTDNSNIDWSFSWLIKRKCRKCFFVQLNSVKKKEIKNTVKGQPENFKNLKMIVSLMTRLINHLF